MKVYVKIALLCLTFTCIFALAACKGTDEKETNPTSENSKTNRILLLKERKSLRLNQIPIQIRRIQL